MSGSNNVLKPSVRLDLDRRTMDTASNFGDRCSGIRSVAESKNAAAKTGEDQSNKANRNCDKDLGEPFENDIKNTSPNATNLSR